MTNSSENNFARLPTVHPPSTPPYSRNKRTFDETVVTAQPDPALTTPIAQRARPPHSPPPPPRKGQIKILLRVYKAPPFGALLKEIPGEFTRPHSAFDPGLQRRMAYLIKLGKNEELGQVIQKYADGLVATDRSQVKRTFLHIALFWRNIEALRLLLNVPGINVNIQNRDGDTPLCFVCRMRDPPLEMVKMLLAAPGINPNIKSFSGTTPLQRAFKHDHLEIVKLLLDKWPELANK
jgi:hypothetical protein